MCRPAVAGSFCRHHTNSVLQHICSLYAFPTFQPEPTTRASCRGVSSRISSTPEAVSNTGGPLGAFLADILLSQWLGIGSFILIFYVGALGISLVGLRRMKFWDLTYKCLLTSITLSILTGFVTYTMTSHNFWGGNHGHLVNEFLITNTGWWGAIGVNMLLVAAVALVFLRELQTAYEAYRNRVKKHRERIARERAAAEARRRQMEAMMTDDEVATADNNTSDESSSDNKTESATPADRAAETMTEHQPAQHHHEVPTYTPDTEKRYEQAELTDIDTIADDNTAMATDAASASATAAANWHETVNTTPVADPSPVACPAETMPAASNGVSACIVGNYSS